jgi:hypothetical protein
VASFIRRHGGRKTPDQLVGVEDMFGEPTALQDLPGKIGRDDNTNANLTRRMLSFSSR